MSNDYLVISLLPIPGPDTRRKNGRTAAVVRASPKLTGTDRQADRQTGRQDHLLSQADALTKNIDI